MSNDDPADLGECFKHHAKRLFQYVLFLTRGDKALAEDVVDDAFVAAAQQWDTLQWLPGDQIHCWLRTTARNMTYSEFRRRDVARRSQPKVDALYRPAEAETDRDALSKIALDRCWAVIDAMPERRHVVATMHWRDGMKPGEIAEELGISVSTVNVHLLKARHQLNDALGAYHPFAKGASEGGATS